MKPMPFNRRAFLKNTVVSSAAAVDRSLPASASHDALVSSATASRSRLSAEEQALIRAAVEQRIAAGEHSPL